MVIDIVNKDIMENNATLHLLEIPLNKPLTKIKIALIKIQPSKPAAATPSISQNIPFAVAPPFVTACPSDVLYQYENNKYMND